ncbi:hypothetical protein FPV67DRAFT_1420628 [Lyophyllum atratum]|nr:hypothetical protein FPV67DRAFT_1420628 [Lyophyllum atratum]
MDPVSIITAIPQLIAQAKAVYDFVQKFRKAGDSCSKLMTELDLLAKTLIDLKALIGKIENSRSPQGDSLLQLRNHVNECSGTLDAVRSKFGKSRLKNVWKQALWAAKDEAEVGELQLKLERQRSSFLAIVQVYTAAKVTDNGNAIVDIRLEQQRIEKEKATHNQKDTIKSTVKWLAPVDQNSRYKALRNQWQAGTCEWIARDGLLEPWLSSPGSSLWLYGISGSGKSVLVSSVIDYLWRRKSSEEITLFHFCDFSNSESTDPINVLRTLLAQLLKHCEGSDSSDILEDLSGKQSRGESPPSILDDLVDLLRRACATSHWRRVFIVIDALDECSRDEREDLLGELVQLAPQSDRISLFVTSRREQDILEIFGNGVNMTEIALTDHQGSMQHDIARHVSVQLEKRKRLQALPEHVKDKIKNTLLDRADGMFRWVDLQLELLRNHVLLKDIDSTLQNLPKGLSETYIRMLPQDETSGANVAQRSLRWLVGAGHPLLLSQLAEAIMVEAGSRKLNADFELPREEYILECCSALVWYDNEEGTVSISHNSVQEFLFSTDLKKATEHGGYYMNTFEHLHKSLATLTFSYLLLDDFSSGPCSSAEELESRLAAHPFITYAADSWISHVSAVKDQDDHFFTQLHDFVFNSSHLASHQSRRQFSGFLEGEGMKLGVWPGTRGRSLESFRGTTLDVEVNRILTPLIRSGPVWLVKRLTEMYPHLKDRAYFYCGTPLMIATLENNLAMIKMLLDAGADVNKAAMHYRLNHLLFPPIYLAITLIHCAAQSGRADVLRLLIDHGEEVNTMDRSGMTPLHHALRARSFSAVEILVDSGCDVNAKQYSGLAPLHMALDQRSDDIVQVLLNQGASPHECGYLDVTHLEWAVSKPWYAQVRAGIESDAGHIKSRRTKEDVLQVSVLLQDRFRVPISVVRIIFDHAEYWMVLLARCQEAIVIEEGSEEIPYVCTEPIESTQESPVRRIIFTTVSHDQGWSTSNTEWQGTYTHSYTWFEAGTSAPSVARREIQRNVHANPDSRSHTNIWEPRDPTPGLNAWLTGIQCGDTVSVYPKAMCSGWMNYVQSVEIVLYIASV